MVYSQPRVTKGRLPWILVIIAIILGAIWAFSVSTHPPPGPTRPAVDYCGIGKRTINLFFYKTDINGSVVDCKVLQIGGAPNATMDLIQNEGDMLLLGNGTYYPIRFGEILKTISPLELSKLGPNNVLSQFLNSYRTFLLRGISSADVTLEIDVVVQGNPLRSIMVLDPNGNYVFDSLTFFNIKQVLTQTPYFIKNQAIWKNYFAGYFAYGVITNNTAVAYNFTLRAEIQAFKCSITTVDSGWVSDDAPAFKMINESITTTKIQDSRPCVVGAQVFSELTDGYRFRPHVVLENQIVSDLISALKVAVKLSGVAAPDLPIPTRVQSGGYLDLYADGTMSSGK